MKTTFSITYYCRPSKQNKQGQSPIEMCITVNGERLFINLPAKLSPKVFNKKRKPQHIENLLTQFSIKVNDVIEVTVTGIQKYGVFVLINDKYDGLIHISEISS